MFWVSFLSLIALVPSLVVSIGRGCGSESSADFVKASESHFAVTQLSGGTQVTRKGTINVYWHVIKAGENLTEGNIPDSQIKASIQAVNSHYAKSGLSFKLISTDRTTNETWFNYVAPKLPTNTAMKTLLHKGGAADLNVYTVGFKGGPGKSLLGYATFPSSYKDNNIDDGVVIKYNTVPGGSYSDYNEGKNLSHELGHWLGLYHTYQGNSCDGDGDYVADTPSEATSSFGCQIGKDTCPGGGVDPIHNFMDDSYDACIYEFTPGQFTRIKNQIRTYRGIDI